MTNTVDRVTAVIPFGTLADAPGLARRNSGIRFSPQLLIASARWTARAETFSGTSFSPQLLVAFSALIDSAKKCLTGRLFSHDFSPRRADRVDHEIQEELQMGDRDVPQRLPVS